MIPQSRNLGAQSLELKALDPENIAVGNRLATLFHPQRNNPIARGVAISRLLKPTADQDESSVYRVTFSSGTERADLYIGRGLIERSLFSIGIKAAMLGDLSRWEITSCLNQAWYPTFHALTTECSTDVTVIDAGPADDDVIPTADQGYWFSVTTQDRTFETCLVLERSKTLPKFVASLTEYALPPQLDIETQFEVQLACATVPASLASNLSLGDVLLLPSGGLASPSLALLNHAIIPCEIQGELCPFVGQNGRVDLAQIWQDKSLISRGVPMRDTQQTQTNKHGNASMSDNEPMNFDPSNIDVELRFLAGSLQLPLSELGQIGPGYVFNLGTPAAEHITLQVNGRRLAIGELVSVQGELGVRILRTFGGV